MPWIPGVLYGVVRWALTVPVYERIGDRTIRTATRIPTEERVQATVVAGGYGLLLFAVLASAALLRRPSSFVSWMQLSLLEAAVAWVGLVIYQVPRSRDELLDITMVLTQLRLLLSQTAAVAIVVTFSNLMLKLAETLFQSAPVAAIIVLPNLLYCMLFMQQFVTDAGLSDEDLRLHPWRLIRRQPALIVSAILIDLPASVMLIGIEIVLAGRSVPWFGFLLVAGGALWLFFLAVFYRHDGVIVSNPAEVLRWLGKTALYGAVALFTVAFPVFAIGLFVKSG